MTDRITPLILTFNEEANIVRTLESLEWARRIVVVDSGSTDETLDLISTFPRVEVFHRPFDDAASQCNFGLKQIETDWVLSIDADYVLSKELVSELRRLQDNQDANGYSAIFVYKVLGKSLRAALYPPRTVLYRLYDARYINVGHTQKISVPGEIKRLNNVIYHDDRKPLSRWFPSQQKYARLEAHYLVTTPSKHLSWTARVRRLGWLAPLLVIPYVLFVKGCIFDGRAGWYYALQRLIAETMIALELLDRRLSARNQKST